MDAKRKENISKFLSLILRHKPDTVGLKLDENGWTDVVNLIEACARQGRGFTLEELLEVVETNDKKRFVFDETGERIRASQGHSIVVDVGFDKQVPPATLYHGTAERNLAPIMATGLQKMKRHHVHLSADTGTAKNVGIRYGKPVVLKVDTVGMIEEGFEFYISANGVWLVDTVPVKFLTLHDIPEK